MYAVYNARIAYQFFWTQKGCTFYEIKHFLSIDRVHFFTHRARGNHYLGSTDLKRFLFKQYYNKVPLCSNIEVSSCRVDETLHNNIKLFSKKMSLEISPLKCPLD